MKSVWMIVLSVFTVASHASEFKHIKLSPAFESALVQNANSSSSKSFLTNKTRVTPTAASEQALNKLIRTKLLGGSGVNGRGPGPFQDGVESPLLEEIRLQLELSHQGIGQAQVSQINSYNQQFNMGSQNFSGFSWQKPFGTVDIHVDRQITPPAMVDEWMIRDTFTFSVKATTFLEKLKEAGLSTMSNVEIGAFAGITFQRVYTYDHFAKTYNDCLVADYSKLFLPFLKFNTNGIAAMKANEVMKRDDLWTLKAGALITSPPMYGFSVSGGVLAQADLTQTVGVEYTGKSLNLAVLSKKAVTAGATASLQIDFFKLIQLTLLRYDLSYTYASGKEFVLGVTPAQYLKIQSHPEEKDEFKKLMSGWGDVKLLEPYVTMLKDTTTQTLESHGSVLLWGRTRKSGKEVISNIKDGVVHLFHKDYAQSTKYMQNLLSRLFSAVFYKILSLPMGVQNTAIYTKEVEMQYKVSHPQAADPEIVRLNSSEEFSFDLNQMIEVHGTTKKSEKSHKADVIWFIDQFTTLPKTLVDAFKKDELKGPVRVESTVKIEKAGFDFFVKRPLGEFFAQIAWVCKSKKLNDWVSDVKRPAMLQAKQSGAEKCVKDMGLDVMDFLSDYQANHSKPAIAKFSKFLKAYYKLTESANDLAAIFGANNTFMMSKIEATSPIGTTFSQTVSHGQFRGLGVIDNFNRSVSRAPASK